MAESAPVRRLLQHSWAPRILQSPLTYKLAKLGYARRDRYALESQRMMAAFGLDLMARALAQRRFRVWSTGFFPSELLYAAGLSPFAPEVAAGAMASLDLSPQSLRQAEQSGFDADMCSFHCCAAGSFLQGLLPPPGVLLASGHLCEGGARLFHYLARQYQVPLFCLDIPAVTGPDAEEYLSRQLAEIADQLPRLGGPELTPSRWRETIAYSNRAREALLAVERLRQESPSPLGRDEGLAYVFLQFMGFGHERTAVIVETLVREMERRIEQAGDPKTTCREKYRLLWLHLKPYFPTGLFELLEDELGARVVMEEMNHVYWPPLDPADPFRSLARKIISHPGVGPVSRRIEAVARLAREQQVQGVVHYSHWGCRQAVGALPLLKQGLGRKGLPFLSLEGDCVDPAGFFPGQVRTRLEGFVEMLEQAMG